jgi:hypothetical protein
VLRALIGRKDTIFTEFLVVFAVFLIVLGLFDGLALLLVLHYFIIILINCIKSIYVIQ